MKVSRRFFIGGASAFGALGAFGGARAFAAGPGHSFGGGKPKLAFGVLSDIHLRPPRENNSVAMLVKALTWLRDKGVDGVVISGDIADHGTIRELQMFADAWWMVFPRDRAPDGRPVARLFVYGNHDMGGPGYVRDVPSFKGLSADEVASRIIYPDPKKAWESVFHEAWKPIWTKDVKGYRFVGAQWLQRDCNGFKEHVNPGMKDFYAAFKADPKLPFFHIQHAHPRDTCYGPWAWGRDDGMSTAALSGFPNAIAFSGHSHYSLTDERSVWQGAFTSVGASSLRYSGAPRDSREPQAYENSHAMNSHMHLPEETEKVMEVATTGWAPYVSFAKQAMLWRVYDDCCVAERRDIGRDDSLGADWIIPLAAAEPRPFSFVERAKKATAPEFPADAVVTFGRQKRKTRGYWGRPIPPVRPKVERYEAEALELVFPPAKGRSRIFEYEIVAVGTGGERRVFRVLASGWNLSPDSPEAKGPEKVLLNVATLPKDLDHFEITPMDCWWKAGKPLVARCCTSECHNTTTRGNLASRRHEQ